MLPDLSAVPSWAAASIVILTTVTTTVVALARVLVRAIPQTANARLEWWREILRYRLTVRELKDARRARRRTLNAHISSGDTDAARTKAGQRESADP
ncbi:hypothetical protein SAMN05216489_01883 [Streptomyces sp. 3213]|uniref:hypothetical protein n=1 Tax=Streptomyces sp. 3213.3 TaxID=1855348 RepID=UPI0008976BD1|nr:hypothetical protein [Streptomyces sp. 3213.3]SEC88737.1 hypothetical protein SAMN05216489_01883 [Streptomyces sp. 3213] [Streptomyces sp. 3213.3]